MAQTLVAARLRVRVTSSYPRFGAVGEYGSLAVIGRQILVPIRLDAVGREIALYVVWHNQHRPSQAGPDSQVKSVDHYRAVDRGLALTI